tara:strand:- start:472 stop:744 length:273 start_codon:yes stop_codon:yes gene_type:complete
MSEEQESQGLGDTVEKIITKIGDVTKIEWIRRKKGCSGCRKRKEALNAAFPYKNEQSPGASRTTQENKKSGCSDCEKKKKRGGCKDCGKK